MAVTSGSPVKFVYVGANKTRPATPDPNTIYLDEQEKAIYVGSALIADHSIPTDISGYNVKDIDLIGSGNFVQSITLNTTTKRLQITLSTLPTLAKGTDTTGTAVTLTPGGSFTAMTDTAVDDHTITDQNTTFTLPAQVTSVSAAKNGAGNGIQLTITKSDSTSSTTDSGEIFGDMAWEDSADYMTVTDGATKAELEDLAGEVTGAMHYQGVTTTAVTDGGSQTATIGGKPLTAEKGDVVLYQAKEFVWDGTTWHELGDGSSFALNTVRVDGGTGLTGGGAISGDVTISHQAKPSTGSSALPTAVSGLEVVSDVTIDTLGHVASASKTDLATAVNGAIDTKLGALDASVSGDYITSITQTDGTVSATAGTKGAVLENNTSLVDGGTVYTAVEAAKAAAITAAQPVWEVVE